MARQVNVHICILERAYVVPHSRKPLKLDGFFVIFFRPQELEYDKFQEIH
jgi:hypothetical protein